MPTTRATETPDPTRLAGLKLGNYRLERLLGRGRMGVVYLATDEALLRPTAIKLLSWKTSDAQGHDPVRWFLAEARLVARINHPRVVQIYGAARQDDHCYIAMEYVVGRSAEAMVREGPLAPGAATEILLQAASALHAAHRSGVIHRDVKPANLLVGPGGATKLGDFGMALGSADVSAGNARVRVGTPYYTAPEVWGGGTATAASDVYSLGATYFHLLTGRPPFPGDDVTAVEHGHLQAPAPDPRALAPALPPSCAALVARALAKDPRERHPSALALVWEARRVLQDLAAAVAGAAPAPTVTPRPVGAERAAGPPPAASLPGVPDRLRPLGFARRPFAGAAPAALEDAWAPLATLRARVEEPLEAGAAAVALAAHAEVEDPALRRRLADALARDRLVLSVEVGASPADRSLLHAVCRAAGVAEASSDEASLDALVEAFAEERAKRGRAALVLLGAVAAPHPPARGLRAVVDAAGWSGAFQLVLTGGRGLAAALGQARVGPLAALEVPPLPPADVEPWVRAAIDGALAPGAGPVLLTRDAALLLARRAEGRLDRAETLAENLLVLAGAESRRVITSWHAWAAPADKRLADGATPLPRRPEPWPPADVKDVLDACRREAGLPPWPRGAGREP
jgi:hypothetical protein